MIKRKIKNPTDKNLLRQIYIDKKFEHNDFTDDKWIKYRILLNNKEIGYAYYVIGKDHISAVWIDPKYQRKGLATYLYDYIENDQNIKLKSDASTGSGIAFWKNRLKTRKNPTSELEQFRLDSIKKIQKSADYLADIIAENINSSRFGIYIVGSILNRNKFNENSDVDLAIIIYDKRLANGWNEKLTDEFRDIFQKIPFNFGFLDISVHNNELLPKQEKLKIYEHK